MSTLDLILIIVGFASVFGLIALFFVGVANGSIEKFVYWVADKFNL
jgi:hypothetical protein